MKPVYTMYKPKNSFEVTYVESITVNSTVFCWEKVKYPLQSNHSVKLHRFALFFTTIQPGNFTKKLWILDTEFETTLKWAFDLSLSWLR